MFPGMRHQEALKAAALARAPYDLDRALALAPEAEPEWSPHSVRDGVLRAAAHASPPDRAVELIERMAGGRTAVAAEVAGRAAPTERERLLALAERHADDGALDERIDGLAALVAASHRIDAGRAARAAARVLALATSPGVVL